MTYSVSLVFDLFLLFSALDIFCRVSSVTLLLPLLASALFLTASGDCFLPLRISELFRAHKLYS